MIHNVSCIANNVQAAATFRPPLLALALQIYADLDGYSEAGLRWAVRQAGISPVAAKNNTPVPQAFAGAIQIFDQRSDKVDLWVAKMIHLSEN